MALTILPCLVLGCAPAEDDGPPRPVSVEFKGEIVPSLAGHWRTSGGDSLLDLSKDGKVALVSVVLGQGGKAIAKSQGEWRVDDGRLVLRYASTGGTPQTVSYAYKASGGKLILSTKVPKKDTVYTRS